MKKALKIIVPIFLVLAVLGSLAWYLLVYDTALTRDILLNQARYHESKNNHSLAAWFYDVAYYQSSQDPAVAIELANQYKSIGNYTKAEFTLSGAISQGGSTELYIALCKTYVEQDKLLDAVSMLENVSDPAIKAELDALRPAAPTADHEPGFYTQYISVELSAPNGTLYANPAGEYPTLSAGPCEEAITLPAGETTIYAIAVAENGLVSPLSIFGYTVGGIVEPVSFVDPAVEAAVRTMLNVGEATVLYTNDLWTVTGFEMPAEAESCEDLALMPYLQTLTIHNETMDLMPIGQLSQLVTLDLSGSRPSDDVVTAIGGLSLLETLDLSGCELSTIAGLEGCTAMKVLNLENNTVRNLSPLSAMTELSELNLAHNAVVGLEALSRLTKLQMLDLSYNAVESLIPLGSCAALSSLKAGNNVITALDGVDRLTNLTILDVSTNLISSAQPLSGLKKLSELNLAANQLTDISMLDDLLTLTVFNFADNQIVSLPAWTAEAALVTIDGSNNLLEDLEPLRGMKNLNNVFMDYNALTDISPLFECPRIIQVNIFGNEVTDISGFSGTDVIVNYSPLLGITD